MTGASQELLNFLSGPQGNSGSLQSSYHKNLEQLRDSGDKTFLFLRTILELTNPHFSNGPLSPQLMELLFHSILGFRHVLLHRWTQFHPDFRNTFRDFILSLGLGHESMVHPLPKSASSACLSCSAAFWKRSWRQEDRLGAEQLSAEENDLLQMLHSQSQSFHIFRNTDTNELFAYFESVLHRSLSLTDDEIISNATPLNRATMAMFFLSTLVGEFSGGNTAVAYNCSLEFHRLSHVAFEEKGLQMSLKLAMGGLSIIIPKMASAGSNSHLVHLAVAIVNLTVDVLSWEFGSLGGQWGRTGGTGLVRPPETWREWIIRPDFLGAIFELYKSLRGGNGNDQSSEQTNAIENLKHVLRQLLILLSSITGSIFEDRNEKIAYSGFMVDGCLSVFSLALSELVDTSHKSMNELEELEAEIVDMCSMILKLVCNFRIDLLSQLSSFSSMLSAISTIGDTLLKISVAELKKAQGDSELVEGEDWRNEAVGYLLEAVVLLTEDNWLVSARPGNAQDVAASAMSTALAPFYHSYVSCRLQMAKMEEYFITLNAADLDEVREDIISRTMEEEMSLASSLGRVNLASSLSCLSSLYQVCLPRLKDLFEKEGEMTPDAASLLEEARLLIMCTCHLLTDDCSGETPLIPEAILNACCKPSSAPNDFKRGSEDYAQATSAIIDLVSSLIGVAEFQASRLAMNANNHHLSPLLAKTLLWFFKRWAPAYIFPSSQEYDSTRFESSSGILNVWRTQESAGKAVSFCVTLCLHYQCFWPQETQVQEESGNLLLAIAKRGRHMRILLMGSPSMEHLINLHSLTASKIHASSQLHQPHAGLSAEIINGYKRISYKYRAQLLTAILIASSEIDDPKSENSFSACLRAVQNAFGSLLEALESKRARIDCVITKDMICLCVELFDGIARSSEMCHPERIPIFMSPILPRLSQLMNYYASDIIICELLLKFFRDYAEQFIVMLDREQSLVLFRSSAELLKGYSANHCGSRLVRKATKKSHDDDLEEEQSYSDILCAIQLLNHLGAKDFVDSFSSERNGSDGIDTNEITEVIFFGLQQILPLMTKGLMSFPTLCTQYFSLVGFMMETYPERVGTLPHDLFRGLLDSMLFGMSHTSSFVSKYSLEGLAALAKEQIERKSITSHLAHDENIFDNCSLRLLKEVVFQSIIWDRLEATALALMGLASIDMNRFANVVNKISQNLDELKQQRMQQAFQRLMQPEVLSKVANGNFGGRVNKMRFRKDFEVFVKDIHSAVLIF